nr:SDR family oxidoreductase [Bacillus bingmayongensis]
MRTLSAKGIGNFNSILKQLEERAPLRRNVTQENVGNTALFLFSDLASCVTDETIHVNSRYYILG